MAASEQAGSLELLQDRLQTLEDKQELYELLDRYCKTVDAYDYDGHGNCYTEDGTQHFGAWGPIRGRENIVAATRKAEESLKIMHHYMTNMHFEVSRDKAIGTSSLLMVVGEDTKRPSEVLWHGGPYKWTFEKTSDGWKIKTMYLVSIWVNKEDPSGTWATGESSA